MAKLTRAEAALADRKRRLAALPKKSPAKVLAETFRPATRPEERERGEREQTSAALRPPAPVTPVRAQPLVALTNQATRSQTGFNAAVYNRYTAAGFTPQQAL